MAAFLASQLDFIFFFYGLAFILLGSVCFIIARNRDFHRYWGWLGAFALLHGFGEWLDLAALVIGDTPFFSAIRTALMTTSFALLVEFARRESIRLGLRVPGGWVHLPLLLLVLAAARFGGADTANAVARYSFGLIGAFGSAWIFVRHARPLSGNARYLALTTAVGFASYGILAGAIVPTAPFWPATVLNQGGFQHLTGIPIQLVRGLLAMMLAVSLWAIWGQLLVEEVATERYTVYLRRQFFALVSVFFVVFLAGWLLTQFLGDVYHRNVERQARGDIELLGSRIAGGRAVADAMARSLGGSPAVLRALTGDAPADRSLARQALARDIAAAEATAGYVFDRYGRIVVAAGRERGRSPARDFRSAPWRAATLAGRAGHVLAFGAGGVPRDYYASYPVRDGGGAIRGGVVLKTSLDRLVASLRHFSRPFYLVDARGIVRLTNQPSALGRPLWPGMDARARTVGRAAGRPLIARPVPDGSWTMIDSVRGYVRYRGLPDADWTLVSVTPDSAVFASRVLGIVITLLVTMMVLTYLFARERGVRDAVQMEKRMKLQELTHELRSLAAIDPLTGLYNRAKFDECLESAILRAARHQSPFSIILYDVDHFKAVNDTYGHQAGDEVLVALSQLAGQHIRAADVLARWGGEEFLLLLPGAEAEVARAVAETLRVELGRLEVGPVDRISCSFGVAQYLAGETGTAVVARADAALYRAKVGGRNRVEMAAETVPARGPDEVPRRQPRR